jgi:hypothetical protein
VIDATGAKCKVEDAEPRLEQREAFIEKFRPGAPPRHFFDRQQASWARHRHRAQAEARNADRLNRTEGSHHVPTRCYVFIPTLIVLVMLGPHGNRYEELMTVSE